MTWSPSLTPSRRSSDRFTGATPPSGPIWRQALRGLGLSLQGRPPAAPITTRERQRELELEEAIDLGRWIDDEERALLQEQAAAEREHQRRQERLRLQRRGLLVLACLAVVVPLLWPLVVLGVIVVFPRTSRRLLVAGLTLAFALALAVVLLVGQLLHRIAPPAAPPAAPPVQPSGLPSTIGNPAIRSERGSSSP